MLHESAVERGKALLAKRRALRAEEGTGIGAKGAGLSMYSQGSDIDGNGVKGREEVGIDCELATSRDSRKVGGVNQAPTFQTGSEFIGRPEVERTQKDLSQNLPSAFIRDDETEYWCDSTNSPRSFQSFDSEEEGESRTSGSAVGHEEEEAIKQFLRQHSAPCNPDIQINGIPIPPSPLPQEASEMVPLWSPARSNPIKLTRPAATITLCSGSTMPASTLPVPNSLGLSLAPSSNSTTTNSDSVSARKEGRKKVGDNMVRVLSRSGGNAPNGVRDGANKQVETVAVPEAKDTPSVAAESSTPIGVEFPFEDPRFAVIYSLLHSTLLENYKLSLDFDEQSKCLRKALAREGRMKSEANELEKSKDLLPEALSTIVYLEDDLSMCYEEILSLRSKLSRPSLVHSSTQTDFDHDLKPPGTRIPKPPLPESEGSKATIQLAQLRRELDLALDSLASQQVELNNARDSQKRLEAPERARDESEKQVQSTQSFLDEALQECHGWVHKYQVSQKSEEELIQRNQQLEKKLAAIDKSVVQLQARNKGLLGERNEARHWLDSLKRAKAFT